MILKLWQKAVLVESDQIHLKALTMEEEEFNIPANAFKKIPFVSKELETDGLNLQHAGVLDNFARKILYDEPFLCEGENGLNSLLLCNAIYLSSFLKQTIQFPFDEALYYELLKEKKCFFQMMHQIFKTGILKPHRDAVLSISVSFCRKNV